MEPDRDIRPFLIFLLFALIVICAGLFTPLREKIEFRIEEVKSRLFYLHSNPADTVFVPGQSGTPFASDEDVEAAISRYITEAAPTETEVPDRKSVV